MWVLFAAIADAIYIIAKLSKEKINESNAKAHSNAVQASNVARHAPAGGLWQSMIQPYPNPETWEMDGHTWCYQHPQTKEWYTDFVFTTEKDIRNGGMTEALQRHRNLARYDKVYSGVFSYLD